MKNAIACLALVGGFSVASAADASSIAAGLPSSSYSQSGVFGGDDAESAFNGGFWNAGNFGDQWIQVDLLTSHLVSSVSFATNQEPNGVTSHSVFISDSPIGDDFGLLAPVASRNGFSVTGTQFTFAFSPTSGRYLEIVANGGPSWTSIGRVNAVPVPAALWLFGSTIAGLGMLRRKFA